MVLNITEMTKEFNDETGQGVGLLCTVTVLVLPRPESGFVLSPGENFFGLDLFSD